jgi:ABC-2 type transport system permease protein
MTTFLVLITIFSGISLVLILTKSDFPNLEKVIKKSSIYSLIGILICTVLLIFDFRLKGKYTTTIIGLTFLLSTILLFGLTKKKLTKVLSGILTIPMFVFGILSLIWEMPIVFFHLIALPFQPPFAKSEINNNHNVEVRVGGFMACGESLVITKSQFGILDKQQYVGNNSCVTGITKIETIEFKENKMEFLIYHDGKTEFENPYKYQPEIKNVW